MSDLMTSHTKKHPMQHVLSLIVIETLMKRDHLAEITHAIADRTLFDSALQFVQYFYVTVHSNISLNLFFA